MRKWKPFWRSPRRHVDRKKNIGQPMEPQNRPLERLFNRITLSYDRMNRILTLGMDRRWRRRAAETLVAFEPNSVLDLCTGTGDLAYLLVEMLKENTSVTGLDYSPQMLERAEEKRAGDRTNPRFVLGDAAALPYDPDSFDAVTVSFAFRNLTYRNPRMEETLAEIRRVLRPGGALVIVESSQPRSKVVRFLRDIYVELMVGKIVTRLSDHGPAYRYLADSVKRYYGPSELREILASAGFEPVQYAPLFFGAAGLYVAGSPRGA